MKWSFAVGVVIMTCLVLSGGWAILSLTSRSPEQPRVQDSVVPVSMLPLKPARTAPSGFIEYRNEHYRFALFYSDKLSLKEYDEGGGATTITFQNIATSEGFQIFIVPYGEQRVSEARFKQDVPTGVRKGSRDITIDGAAAISFYGSNATLGDTAEIWIVNGGYLFEVTTLKPLADWLSQIMTSWKFTT